MFIFILEYTVHALKKKKDKARGRQWLIERGDTGESK
jgi:hypothetical protein